MPESKYYLDGELKVIEDELGRKQVGISKRAVFTHDALEDLEKIEDEFVQRLRKFKLNFNEETLTQEEQINRDIAHVRFFLEESKSVEDVLTGAIWGPADITSPYGGVFFYGVHQVEMCVRAFGYYVQSALVTRKKDAIAVGQLLYGDGKLVTLNLMKDFGADFAMCITGSRKQVFRQMPRAYDDYMPALRAFTDMFKTGKRPVSYENMLNPIAILEAMEASILTGSMETVEDIAL